MIRSDVTEERCYRGVIYRLEEITDYSVGRVIRSDVTEWKRSRITVLVE